MVEQLIVDFPSKTTPVRRVSFTEYIDVKFIDDLSEHKSNLYFTDREVKAFKYQAALQLRNIHRMNLTMAEYAEKNVHDTSVFMGLEAHLSENSRVDIIRRRDSIRRAVLYEQTRQNHFGIHDHTKLAAVSLVESDMSRRRARIIGLLHADKD